MYKYKKEQVGKSRQLVVLYRIIAEKPMPEQALSPAPASAVNRPLFRYMPSFLRMLFGMELRLTIIDMVLYSTNGREKYQKPS